MKKSLVTLLLMFLTLPLYAQNTTKNTLLILGDSLSAGYGIERAQGWVQLLTDRLAREHYPYKVINASISGDTTSNGLRRLPAALKKYRPKITIIELGGNDGLRGLQIAVIAKNLQQLVALCKQAGSKVMVLSVPLPPNYGPVYLQQFQGVFNTLAQDKSIKVVPMLTLQPTDQARLIQADGVHPNAEAQPMILEHIWPALQPLLMSQ